MQFHQNIIDHFKTNSKSFEDFLSSDTLAFDEIYEEANVTFQFYFKKSNVEKNDLSLTIYVEGLVQQNLPRKIRVRFSNKLFQYLNFSNYRITQYNIRIKDFGLHNYLEELVILLFFPTANLYLDNIRSKNISIAGKSGQLTFLKIKADRTKIFGSHQSLSFQDMRFTSALDTKSNLTITSYNCDKLSIEQFQIPNIIISRSNIGDISVIPDNISPINISIEYTNTQSIYLSNGNIETLKLESVKGITSREASILFRNWSTENLVLNKIKVGKENYLQYRIKEFTNWLRNSNRSIPKAIKMIRSQLSNIIPNKQPISDNKTVSEKLSLEFIDYHLNEIELETIMVDWNYAGIIETGPFNDNKRRFLTDLKNHYKKSEDILNLQLFKSFEKRWYYENNKFNFPLALSWYSNSFGLSILLPLSWLVLFIFLETLLIIYFSGNCGLVFIEKWGVFMHLLNPTHKTETLLKIIEGNCTLSKSFFNFVYVIDNLFRIVIGYLIFQFINAFRHKYLLK